MKKHAHSDRRGGVTAIDRPASVEEIDLDRIIWDPEYRRAVKPLLGPPKTTKRPDPRHDARARRRPD